MKSIRKTLTRRLSIIISLLVIAVLLAADIGVDSWIEQEFNQAMKAKVGMLQSLVNEDVEGVEFEFAGEYLPEFEGTSSPEYFQLWYKDSTFEKSDTLALYTINELPYSSIGLDEYSFQDITLPDGRTGRVIYTRYIYLRLILKTELDFIASWIRVTILARQWLSRTQHLQNC